MIEGAEGAEGDERTSRVLVGLWSADIVSGLVVADEAVCEYFNVDPAQGVRGAPLRRFLEAVSSDDRGGLKSRIQAAMRCDEPFVASYRVDSALRGSRVVLAKGRCFRDKAGGPVHLSGYIEDIGIQRPVGVESEAMRLHVELVDHLAEARSRALRIDALVLEKLISAVMLEAGHQLAERMVRETKG